MSRDTPITEDVVVSGLCTIIPWADIFRLFDIFIVAVPRIVVS